MVEQKKVVTFVSEKTMRKQLPLKLLLTSLTIIVLIYSAIAFKNEGANWPKTLFLNLTSFNWNGQFNIDFLCYLTLSGLWIMWRNKFSLTSILLGLAAMTIAIPLFAPYILYLLTKENGDLKKVFIGNR